MIRRLSTRLRDHVYESLNADGLDELQRVDPDVVPGDLRRRDLGVPDAAWWSVVFLTSIVIGIMATASLIPMLPEALATGIAWGPMFAGMTFAHRRWGHRQYRVRRAFRDALVALPIGLAAGLLWMLRHAWSTLF